MIDPTPERAQQITLLEKMAAIRRQDWGKPWPEADRPFLEEGMRQADALDVAISALRATSAREWQEITTFRKFNGDAEPVLVYCAKPKTWYVAHMMEGDFCHTTTGALLRHTPTHWQPLPLPPSRGRARGSIRVSAARMARWRVT